MLTYRQFELLRFIDERLAASGVAPSYDEMRHALGLRSKTGVHRAVVRLEERGFIRRLPRRARAIEVLKTPWDRPCAGGLRCLLARRHRAADDAIRIECEADPAMSRRPSRHLSHSGEGRNPGVGSRRVSRAFSTRDPGLRRDDDQWR